MRKLILSATLVAALATLGAPALAGTYPVSGNWGPAVAGKKGAIDCAGKRVIGFNGDQRTDSNGGVPGYRNFSVQSNGSSQYRVVDEFSNGQVHNGRTTYTLRQVDADHIEMQMQGSTLKLQRCKD
jgi:hypothetical protein